MSRMMDFTNNGGGGCCGGDYEQPAMRHCPPAPITGQAPIVFNTGRSYIPIDSVCCIEELNRDALSPHGHTVVLRVVVLHLKTPIIREGYPPSWRVEAEGLKADAILGAVKALADASLPCTAPVVRLKSEAEYRLAMDAADLAG